MTDGQEPGFRFLLGYGPAIASVLHWRLRWVSVLEPGCCRLLNLDDAKAVRMLPCASDTDISDWHPYEPWLVLRQVGHVLVWDAGRACSLPVLPVGHCLAHQFSSDGCWLFVLFEGGLLRRWSVSDWREHRPTPALDITGFRSARGHLVCWNGEGLLTVRPLASPEVVKSQFRLKGPLRVDDVSPDGRWAHVRDATSTYLLSLAYDTLTPLLDKPVQGLFSWASTHLFLDEGCITVLDLESIVLSPTSECWDLSRTGHCARTEGHFHDEGPPTVRASCLLPSPQARPDSVDCYESLLQCWAGVLVYNTSNTAENWVDQDDTQTVWRHDVPEVTLQANFLGWDGDVEWSRVSHFLSRGSGEYSAVKNPHREQRQAIGDEGSPHLDYRARPAPPHYGQRYECRTVFKEEQSHITESTTGRSLGIVQGRFNEVNERFALAWIPPEGEGWVRFQDSSPFATTVQFEGYDQGALHPRKDLMLVSDGRRTVLVNAGGPLLGVVPMVGWRPQYSPSGEYFSLLLDDVVLIHASEDPLVEAGRLARNAEATPALTWLNDHTVQIGSEVWRGSAKSGGWAAPSVHRHCYWGTVLADGFSDLAMERRNGQCFFFSLSSERVRGTLHPMVRHWFFFTPDGLYEGSAESTEFVLSSLDPGDARPGLMGRALRSDQDFQQELSDIDAQISTLCTPLAPYQSLPELDDREHSYPTLPSGPLDDDCEVLEQLEDVSPAPPESAPSAPPSPRFRRPAMMMCPACNCTMHLDQGVTVGWGEFYCCERCDFSVHEHADPAQIAQMVKEHRRRG